MLDIPSLESTRVSVVPDAKSTWYPNNIFPITLTVTPPPPPPPSEKKKEKLHPLQKFSPKVVFVKPEYISTSSTLLFTAGITQFLR